MTSDTSARRVLSDAQLGQMLELMKASDSVELKVTVPDSELRSTVNALGMDPLDAQIRQVFFFDTPELTLDKHGVVVRARRVQGKGDDSVVKLRPVVPSELPAEVRRSPSFGVEVDAMPGGFVCSGSMKGSLGVGAVRPVVVGGDKPIRKLFSKEQEDFFATHAPDAISLDGLSILGPIFVLKLKYQPADYARKLVAELWLYPDDRRILELSTKCLPNEAFQVAAETRAFLAARHVELGGEQQTKTRTALEFFAGQLKKATEKGKTD